MNLAVQDYFLSEPIPHPDERCRGERLLLAATLYDALVILSHPHSRSQENRERYQETVEWFASNESHPFSFLWICWHLSYDPKVIRDEIAHGSFTQKAHRRRLGQNATKCV